MPSLKIRQATPSDAEWFVGNVRALAVEPDKQMPLELAEYTTTAQQQAERFTAAAAEGNLYLIAEAEGVRVGELNLRRGARIGLRHSVTLGISVVREWRGRQVGTALMQHALTWARQTPDIRRIELFVYVSNVPAQRLYTRHGFVVEGRRRGVIFQNGALVDDLIMALYLP